MDNAPPPAAWMKVQLGMDLRDGVGRCFPPSSANSADIKLVSFVIWWAGYPLVFKHLSRIYPGIEVEPRAIAHETAVVC